MTMFSAFADFARNSPITRPIRSWQLDSIASREQNYASRVALLSDTSPLELSGSSLQKKIASAEEVFLLGSGSSVLDVQESVWRRIEAQVSIGFGAWALHSFVPDVYAYGPTRGLRDYERVIREVMKRQDIVRKRPEILFLRSDLPEDIQTLNSLPVSYRASTLIYGRVSPLSNSRNEIVREMAGWHRVATRSRVGLAFDSGSSIVRLISLALLLGAKKIVLVGVDLNTVEYFWEKNPVFLADNGFESFETGQKNSVHDTLLASSRPLGVVPILEDMSRLAQQERGCVIEVMSARSALASVLPIYSPNRFERST